MQHERAIMLQPGWNNSRRAWTAEKHRGRVRVRLCTHVAALAGALHLSRSVPAAIHHGKSAFLNEQGRRARGEDARHSPLRRLRVALPITVFLTR